MTRQRRDRGLRKIFQISVMSGILGQIFGTLSGPGSAFLTKFAIMLNATPIHFAILSAIGQVSSFRSILKSAGFICNLSKCFLG